MGLGLSGPKRWAKAVSDGLAAVETAREHAAAYEDNDLDKKEAEKVASNFEAACGAVEDAFSELSILKDEYDEWYNSMPENLQQSETGQKCEAVAGLYFDWRTPEIDGCEAELDSAEEMLNEAENADLPREYGRD